MIKLIWFYKECIFMQPIDEVKYIRKKFFSKKKVKFFLGLKRNGNFSSQFSTIQFSFISAPTHSKSKIIII